MCSKQDFSLGVGKWRPKMQQHERKISKKVAASFRTNRNSSTKTRANDRHVTVDSLFGNSYILFGKISSHFLC
jgi:hypothetical protein